MRWTCVPAGSHTWECCHPYPVGAQMVCHALHSTQFLPCQWGKANTRNGATGSSQPHVGCAHMMCLTWRNSRTWPLQGACPWAEVSSDCQCVGFGTACYTQVLLWCHRGLLGPLCMLSCAQSVSALCLAGHCSTCSPPLPVSLQP